MGLLRMIGLCALAGVLLAGILSPMAIGVGSLSNQISDSVDSISSQLAVSQVPLVTTIEDSTGAPIAELFQQYRLPVSYNQISPNMRAAIVDIEDHRFYQESGIDVQGTIRAAMHDSSGGSTQGASTLTQQYVKNYLEYIVDRAPVGATHEQQLQAKAAQQADIAASPVRKLKEAKVAIQLAQTMSKNDILTGYLNIVPFGKLGAGPFGIGAAAQAYFGVTPDKLTIPQSALLAGMVNNPILYDPYSHPDHAMQRRNAVLKAMATYGSISQADADKYSKEPLGVVANGPNLPSSTCLNLTNQDTGFFCDYALQYLENAGFTADQLATGGYTIKTTLDPTVSAAAKQAANDAVDPNTPGIANTFVVIKPGTNSHDVLAMVANRNYGTGTDNSQKQTNMITQVSDPFGGGSTYKLITTAAGMELGHAGLNTVLQNPSCTTFPSIGYGSKPYPVCNNDGTRAHDHSRRRPRQLAKHRVRRPGIPERHGQRTEHGLSPGHAQHVDVQPERQNPGPERQEQFVGERAADPVLPAHFVLHSGCRPAQPPRTRQHGRHHRQRRRLVRTEPDRLDHRPVRQDGRRQHAALRTGHLPGRSGHHAQRHDRRAAAGATAGGPGNRGWLGWRGR